MLSWTAMKIIDKRKDYYDYLQGIFGQDPLAVYDRRDSVVFNSNTLPLPLKPIPAGTGNGYYGVLSLLCGLCFHKIYFENLPGEKLQFEEFDTFRVTRETVVPLRLRIEYREYRSDMIKGDMKFIPNSEKQGFPIRYPRGGALHEDEYFSDGKDKWWKEWHFSYSNPILSSIPLIIVPAETVFEELHEFLLSLNDKKIEDSRTDVQKLESAGFDKKTSFRKM